VHNLNKTLSNIGLIGNPNCGKSTLFNRLTGLRQNTSNLPGTTVERKTGDWKFNDRTYKITDLPGIYSLFTRQDEEGIVTDHLIGKKYPRPDVLIFLLDASNLRRNLLLFTQVQEIGIPAILCLTMADTAKRRGIKIDTQSLAADLNAPVVLVNPRTGEGLDTLKEAVMHFSPQSGTPNVDFLQRLEDFRNGAELRGLAEETLKRYNRIEPIVKKAVSSKDGFKKSVTTQLDRIFTHPVLGYLVFFIIMLTIFQGVFTLAEYPMTWIENGFNGLSELLSEQLGDSFISRILTGGIIPGLSGVLVFLPQIAILFFFIAILEDSGYMVRTSFITDKVMRRIGLNGRSVIPLIGGFACAIPSIMATRSIKNKAERMATMIVIPLMSCSARLPVYVLLVSLAVPSEAAFGPFSLQSLIITLAYFSGIILAFAISWTYKIFKKQQAPSEFILEMPAYQLPRLQTVWTHVWHKSKSFVTEAGKIIMIISLVLWFLSSYGPGNALEKAKQEATNFATANHLSADETALHVNAAQLKASYAGIMGQWIEPAIRPLGYDWRTGIALVSSFAAREVFVGTMSTLFGNSAGDEIEGIRAKMKSAKNPETGKPLYGLPYALSLIVFYAFALQCMSTLAVLKRETGSWKLPLIQFFGYGALAWIAAFIVYNCTVYFS